MGAGFTVLTVLAAVLGLTLMPVAELLGAEAPEETLLVAALGLVAALIGLAVGWAFPADRLLGPLSGLAGRGFRVGGGFDGLVVRPALAFARALDALDRGIHTGVLAVGSAALAVANASRATDEKGIDGLIVALGRSARRLGNRARTLQTGLVHKELLLAAVGGALVFALLIVGSIGL
jgi:NADH-quinone oxidoreductase subunit L